MANADMTMTVRREPEAQPITFGDAVLLMLIAFWLFRSPSVVSGWIVLLAFVLSWITNLIYRLLYPVTDYFGSDLVRRIINRRTRKRELEAILARPRGVEIRE